MNPFSTAIAKEVFASYPQWKEFAREETAEDGTTYLFIDVPAPNSSNAEHGLWIHTDNEEVTVSFDFYHTHFDSWNVREEGSEHEAAMPFVQAILSEAVAVASWWHGDNWRGSCQVQAGKKPEMSPAQAYSRVRVRSWQGTGNEDRDA